MWHYSMRVVVKRSRISEKKYCPYERGVQVEGAKFSHLPLTSWGKIVYTTNYKTKKGETYVD